MKRYLEYKKSELIDKISKLEIIKVGETVVTKYNDRVINTTVVSNIYEIFDISKYIINKIDLIEENFKISKYRFELTKGRQYLELLSDEIDINGVTFLKSFYILNSSDRSRRLGFNSGLFSNSHNFYMISNVSNLSLSKRHTRGVTQSAEEVSIGLNGETFNEQIESLESLVGHRVKFSKIRDVILGEGNVPKVNHRKFDTFKNSVSYLKDKGIKFTPEQNLLLHTGSERITNIKPSDDFTIDAFWVLQNYLKIFNKEDSHIIKNETDRIMKITQFSIRNEILESLGI